MPFRPRRLGRGLALLALTAVLPLAGSHLVPGASTPAADAAPRREQEKFTDQFFPSECGGFSNNGRNPYFILEPGYRLVLEGRAERENVQLTITVLNETLQISNIPEIGTVTTRVVEERELKDGKLFEVARNFFAICNRTNSVFYFGEDVDFYENGVIVNHDGTWRAGRDGARPGVIMPGTVLLGARYFQEVAPGVALDQAEIISLSEDLDTPGGKFKQVLKTRETTPLEPRLTEFKFYARGVGLIADGPIKLVKHGPS